MPYINFEKIREQLKQQAGARDAGIESGIEGTIETVSAPGGSPEVEPEDDISEGERDALYDALQALSDRKSEVQAAGGDPEILHVVDDETASLLQSFTDEDLSSVQARPYTLDGREVAYDSHDLSGWIKSFSTWRRGKGRHEWIDTPGPPVRIPNQARIAVLGDWGTGRYGAVTCAQTIMRAPLAYDVLVHLGDVYYSGTRDEVKRNFLDLWPFVPGATHRACNSNHEMYAGGFGYFELTLPRFGQQASFFCLENDYFRIIGLDTGYQEGDLAGSQASWVQNLVAGAGNRKVVLLTHHQPFSLKEKQYTKLVKKLRSLLEQRRIFAWYWGHEHRCVVHDRHETWGLYGRCIGHSGYPYFRDRFSEQPAKVNHVDDSCWYRVRKDGVPDGLMLDGSNADIPEKADKYGPNGFAHLELTPGGIIERILSADGKILLESRLSG